MRKPPRGRPIGPARGPGEPGQRAADRRGPVERRAEEHLGVERAGHYLRRFYPWYADLMGLPKGLRAPLVEAPTTAAAREALDAVAGALARSR